MANKSFNFSKAPRSFFTVTFEDKKTLVVNMPKKHIFDKMMNNESSEEDQINYIYQLVTDILNNNKNNEEITKEYVEKMLDIEALNAFLTEYMEFVNTLQNSPN